MVVVACCVDGAPPDRVPAVVVGGIVPAAQPSGERTVRLALLSYHSVITIARLTLWYSPTIVLPKLSYHSVASAVLP